MNQQNQNLIFNILSTVIAIMLSFKGVFYLKNIYELSLILQGAIGIIFFPVLYFFIRHLIIFSIHLAKQFNRMLDNASIENIIGATSGLLIGLLLGVLTSYPFFLIKGYGNYLAVLVFFLFSYFGLQVGMKRSAELWRFLPFPKKNREEKETKKSSITTKKVLDTSAIIDGRIYDVCLTRFLEGTLIVPVFVIEELQHIADSEDSVRRNKGRRGLDLLSKMQKHPEISIDILEDSIDEEKEVDMKLIRLCKKQKASIITNDYNLNKVAEVQGIKVLNINELANAVKVIVYPGELMHITVLKEGKEAGQGVGYLDDGTMIVVEDARDALGKNVEVIVTSVFQTAAGRMIFTRKTKEENNFADTNKDRISEVDALG